MDQMDVDFAKIKSVITGPTPICQGYRVESAKNPITLLFMIRFTKSFNVVILIAISFSCFHG